MTAFKLIKEHKNIETVVKKLEEDNRLGTRKRKWHIPESFNYVGARELFMHPVVIEDINQLEVSIFIYSNLIIMLA